MNLVFSWAMWMTYSHVALLGSTVITSFLNGKLKLSKLLLEAAWPSG